MAEELRGKRALVTGAGTRVGASIARALGAEGMDVAVHHHGSSAGAVETCRAIEAMGGHAHTVSADLFDERQLQRLVDDTLQRFGGLDLLVPSAANFEPVTWDAADAASFERSFALNLRAPFFLAQHCASALREASGSIVFITCVSHLTPHTGYLPYQASKAALNQIMRVLSLELAPSVRVNAVAPGTVLPPPEMSAERVSELASELPLGRIGSADAVAQAVVYLARSRFVTGTELVVDGGRSLAT
jgi:pteridine reductase